MRQLSLLHQQHKEDSNSKGCHVEYPRLRRRNCKGRRRRRRLPILRNCLSLSLLCVVIVLSCVVANANASTNTASISSNNDNTNLPLDFLDEKSVVLITGIAGFIGSELAMALHRTFEGSGQHSIKIIGVDSMDDGFGSSTAARSAEELGVFDFRRQRLFHVLQTLGDRCHFYRIDFRPNLPDYQDRGEVPVLDHIFASHPDITHVVHLADPYGSPSLLEEGEREVQLKTQAVPRKKEQIKAGMMEALLEQLRKAGKLHPDGRIPHFTYASSAHVYNHYDLGSSGTSQTPKNGPPFVEDKPITTPSSIHGASKLLDEIVAQTYYQTEQIYSVGLRFFDVYGPWSSPGTFLFDLAERAVRGGGNDNTFLTKAEEKVLDDASRDYVYIDDAVDAILAAMQFRPSSSAAGGGDKQDNKSSPPPPPPVVINVGSGQGTTFRTMVQLMQQFLATTVSSKLPPPSAAGGAARRSISYASTTRAKELLGFESRVSLAEGMLHLLAWHHDRAFPYGSVDSSSSSPNKPHHHPMAGQGIVSCSPWDAECLKGAPVFPCASECSHRNQCTPSFYDSVLETTRQWTASCEAVLYTVNLDDDLTAIPSATAVVSSTSQSHVENDQGGHCNLAFVSSTSPLVKTLRQKGEESTFTTSRALKHGFWTLVPVDLKEDQREFFLEFLPKLSPGLFFGGDKTKRIIYCDPAVIIDSIPKLLAEAAMQPLYQASDDNNNNKDDITTGGTDSQDKQTHSGATAMLIGKGRQSQSSRKGHTPLQEAVQDSAYRSVRISVIDQMSGDGFALPLDSSFIVHTLQSEDSRLFRCDVFGELIQWHVGTDQSAFSFCLELHDMWSSVIVKQSGLQPWWVGEQVVTIPEGVTSPAAVAPASQKRRLLEVVRGGGMNNADATAPRGAQQLKVEDKVADHTDEEGETPSDRDKNDAVKAATTKGDANFGDGGSDEDPVSEDGGAEVIAARKNEDKEDDTVIDDDEEEEDANIPAQPDVQSQERDVSAYDTWMGVLSSTAVQYFVRIVPSSEAGVVVLDDYDF